MASLFNLTGAGVAATKTSAVKRVVAADPATAARSFSGVEKAVASGLLSKEEGRKFLAQIVETIGVAPPKGAVAPPPATTDVVETVGGALPTRVIDIPQFAPISFQDVVPGQLITARFINEMTDVMIELDQRIQTIASVLRGVAVLDQDAIDDADGGTGGANGEPQVTAEVTSAVLAEVNTRRYLLIRGANMRKLAEISINKEFPIDPDSLQSNTYHLVALDRKATGLLELRESGAVPTPKSLFWTTAAGESKEVAVSEATAKDTALIAKLIDRGALR